MPKYKDPTHTHTRKHTRCRQHMLLNRPRRFQSHIIANVHKFVCSKSNTNMHRWWKKHTAVIKYSVHTVLCSKHTHTHWLRFRHIWSYTWARRQHQLMMCIRSPQRFALESETHICHPTRLRFWSPFNYIFIFVVAEWCITPWSATDPSPTQLQQK